MDPVLYMAPVRGITENIYRNTYSRFFEGYDLCVTPFITNNKVKKVRLKDISPGKNSAAFGLIPQILEKGECIIECV